MSSIMMQSIVGFQWALEQFNGSDASGSDGATNRVITASAVDQALGEIMIIVDAQILIKTTHYTVSGNDITFLIKLWDNQKVDVRYIQ